MPTFVGLFENRECVIRYSATVSFDESVRREPSQTVRELIYRHDVFDRVRVTDYCAPVAA